MRVRITEMAPMKRNGRTEFESKSYVAERKEDCRDSTDRSVYEMVELLGRVVRAGMVIGEPA